MKHYIDLATFTLCFAGLQNSSVTCDRYWHNREQFNGDDFPGSTTNRNCQFMSTTIDEDVAITEKNWGVTKYYIRVSQNIWPSTKS